MCRIYFSKENEREREIFINLEIKSRFQELMTINSHNNFLNILCGIRELEYSL